MMVKPLTFNFHVLLNICSNVYFIPGFLLISLDDIGKILFIVTMDSSLNLLKEESPKK